MKTDKLQEIAAAYGTPCFVFDTDAFAQQAEKICQVLGDEIPLCYSIKANPFLLAALPEEIGHVEVCSPGELSICERLGIDPEMIIYSGVNKEETDIRRAIAYGVGIVTAESPKHLRLVNETAKKLGRQVRLVLRLSSGNQFGMDRNTVTELIDRRAEYPAVRIIGLHYYSGTQKKKPEQIEKEIKSITAFLEELETGHGFHAEHVEYGPGMAVEYFNAPFEEKDEQMLVSVGAALRELREKYVLTVEMGRFLASSCGTYLTKAADIKETEGTSYVICDGGINHLKYYGQTMAMQVPPITVLPSQEILSDTENSSSPVEQPDTASYTLCGSLCTTADLLVRKVELPVLREGSVLAFGRCGAYTITEGIGLFLSRTLPAVVLYSEADGAKLVRDFYDTDLLNTPKQEAET